MYLGEGLHVGVGVVDAIHIRLKWGIYIYLLLHIHTHIYIYTYIYMYISVYIYIYIYICLYIYIYIYIYIYTHTHTYLGEGLDVGVVSGREEGRVEQEPQERECHVRGQHCFPRPVHTSSKVNLPHAINLRALCGATLVT